MANLGPRRRGRARPGQAWGEYLMTYDGSWVRPRDGHVWGTPEPRFNPIIEGVNYNGNQSGYNTNATSETESYSMNGMNENRGAENDNMTE